MTDTPTPHPAGRSQPQEPERESLVATIKPLLFRCVPDEARIADVIIAAGWTRRPSGAGVQLDRVFIGDAEYVLADEAIRQIMALQAALALRGDAETDAPAAAEPQIVPGLIVYVEPIGNAYPGDGSVQLEEREVRKVGRVWATIKGRYSNDDRFSIIDKDNPDRPFRLLDAGGYSSHGRVWFSREAFANYRVRKVATDAIIAALRNERATKSVATGELVRFAALLTSEAEQ